MCLHPQPPENGADISLFDHVKLTAAIASCIYKYIQENKIDDLKRYLFIDGKSFMRKKSFYFFLWIFPGIQKFIYTVTTKKRFENFKSTFFLFGSHDGAYY